MDNPQVGDVVQLKSGGPAMVIDKLGNEGVVTCQWFLEGEVRSGQFHRKTLQAVEADPGAASLTSSAH